MKKVILGIDSWYPQVDGVTNAVVNYRKNLSEPFSADIVAPSYGKKCDEEGEERYCEGVFHNRSLAVPFIGFRNSVPASDRKLKKMLSDQKPAILHAHSPFAICKFFAKYGKKHGIPVVYTFHTKYKDEFYRVTHSRLIAFVMTRIILSNIRRADYVWAVSENAAQTLSSYGYRGKISVVRNGTDMKAASSAELAALSAQVNTEYDLAPGTRVLLFVGRVVSVKNLAFSFRVFAELKRRGATNYKFFVVGGGEELEQHKKLARKLGIADDVVFTGFVGDREIIRRYYARADLFLLPSVFDNAPLVVLEAAACHTPALVPRGSSAAEVITDGETGFAETLDEKLWADKIETCFSEKYYAVREQCARVLCSWKDAVAGAAQEYERVLSDYQARRQKNKEKQ